MSTSASASGRPLLRSLGLALAGLALSAAAQAAIVVALSPVTQHANIGDTVSVEVGISGLGSEVLSAFDLNLFFSPAVLSSGGPVSFDTTNLGGPWLFGEQLNPGNMGLDGNALTLDDDALAAVQADDAFAFLRLSFTALADGVTILGFGPDPDFERAVFGRADLNGFARQLDAAFGTACVAVGTGSCTVPEPSSYALVGLALTAAFLPALRRRQRTR